MWLQRKCFLERTKKICVYRWEPIGDSRSGLKAFLQWFCWCYLALKLKYAILVIFIFKHDFRVPWLVPAVLRHHGGCGWPCSRWTSVHQQPSDWFNHCIVMFPCREINGSLHLHGPSSQPQYEFQPCDHRTCVSSVSLGRLLLHYIFFLRCSCKLSGIFFVYVCVSFYFCTILLFCQPVFMPLSLGTRGILGEHIGVAWNLEWWCILATFGTS